MRGVSLGVATIGMAGIFVAAGISWRGDALAQQPTAPAVKPLVLSDGLIALSSDTADGKQQIVVIDSKTRGMSVYHVDHASGAITLRSARNILADLQMDEFNTNHPLPEEIRSLLRANKDKR